MLLLLAGAFAGVVCAQTDPYGPPGSQGQPGQYGQQNQDQYGQQGQYDDNDWSQSNDWYDQQANDRNDGYEHGQAPNVDVGFFYGELSPYGEWVRHPYYGWVWFPRHVQANWRPYSVGRWVQSDYGWTWVSDEPFGWATYHYGRWTWDGRVGWLWVPGTDWAPAWVAWQQGNGYIGWAPLPPAVGFDMRAGIQLGGFSLSFGIAPRNYAFVEERRFLDSRIGGYIVPEARNITIIHNTTNITNYTVVNNRVINVGVPVERVERATGRRAQRLRVAEATNARSAGVQRDVINVYRPAESKLETVKVAKRNNAGLRKMAPPPARPAAQVPAARSPEKAQKPQQRPEMPIAVAPRAQPVPQKSDERQFAREQQALKANQDKQQRALEQAQRQEQTKARAQAADAQAVQQRHAAELKEQQLLRERTAQQLQARQQIERQAAQASAENAKKQQAERQAAQASAKSAKQQQQQQQAEQQKAKKVKKDNKDNKNNQNQQNDNQKPPQ